MWPCNIGQETRQGSHRLEELSAGDHVLLRVCVEGCGQPSDGGIDPARHVPGMAKGAAGGSCVGRWSFRLLSIVLGIPRVGHVPRAELGLDDARGPQPVPLSLLIFHLSGGEPEFQLLFEGHRLDRLVGVARPCRVLSTVQRPEVGEGPACALQGLFSEMRRC